MRNMSYDIPNRTVSPFFIKKYKGEDATGPIEYKQELSHMTDIKIKKYATQMKFRLIEGGGQSVYFIGLHDDGTVIGVLSEKYFEYCAIMNRICDEITSDIIEVKMLSTSKLNHYIMKFTIQSSFDIDSIFIF